MHQAFKKAFSLIELLIVVAIILIIAAIASRTCSGPMAANESSGVGSLRPSTRRSHVLHYVSVVGFAALGALGGSPGTCATTTGATSTGPA